jgi:hypothetical protein
MDTVGNQITLGNNFHSHPSWLDTGEVGRGYCSDTLGRCCETGIVWRFPFVVRVYRLNCENG